MDLLSRLARDEGGASLVEYSIVIGLIAAATIALIQSVGTKVYNAWCGVDATWMRSMNATQCDGTASMQGGGQ